MKLFDSNILIYSSDKDYAVLKKLLHKNLDKCLVSSASIIECLGYHKITIIEKKYLEHLFSQLQIIDISREIIYEATKLRQSKKMSLGDSIIAATALHHNIPLYTRNTNDFKHIDNLILVNPFEK